MSKINPLFWERDRKWVKGIFRNLNDEPFWMTEGQSEIFRAIYDPSIPRVVIRTITQYGKSDITSMALLKCAVSRREKILIIAPSEKQASIIMGYVIGHLFDHPYLVAMIEFEGSLERLKNERSKTRITFKNGSEIFILSADARTISKEGRSLMGFGATIVVIDESSLIPDEIFSKILRMIGGVSNGKLIQIGNPFFRNHFYRAFYQDRYLKIIVKKEQAIKEGRITGEFLKEAKENMTPLDYEIFYENEFPEGGAEDTLIPWDWIDMAINNKVLISDDSSKGSGLDVARFGRDKSVYGYRIGGSLKKLESRSGLDTMAVAGWVMKELDVDEPDYCNIDVIGIGSGVYDRLDEEGYEVESINVGESPTTDADKKKFHNLRAQIFWYLREWFKPEEGKSRISIMADMEAIEELREIRYKYSSEKKIRIEDKEEMKKRIGRSPDKADCIALTFWESEPTSMEIY